MEDTRKAREAKPKEGVSDVLSRGASSVPEERKAGGSWMDFSFRQSYTLQPSGVGAPGGFVREGSAGERGRTFAPPADSPPGGSGTAPRLPAREEGAAGRTASRREASRESSQASAGSSLIRTVRRMGAGIREDLGNLAAKFESGEEGIAAIGYDRHGGTSYGKFQIASRVGTMGKFLRYLEDKAPDLATRLASSGPANTGGRAGKMPEAWKGIAAEDPQRFERLQNDFIRESHFQPAVQQLAENTGVFVETMPAALQEVVFSTAVQHGPSGAFRIISRALGQVGEGRFSTAQKSPERLKQAGEELIRRIYALRAGQFASSTRQVQAAARERLRLEMRDALALLT